MPFIYARIYTYCRVQYARPFKARYIRDKLTGATITGYTTPSEAYVPNMMLSDVAKLVNVKALIKWAHPVMTGDALATRIETKKYAKVFAENGKKKIRV